MRVYLCLFVCALRACVRVCMCVYVVVVVVVLVLVWWWELPYEDV